MDGGGRLNRSRLPEGLTPRLLSREAAAAYCGMSPPHFDRHIAEAVPPRGFGRRLLWDRRAIDLWLDRQFGPFEDGSEETERARAEAELIDAAKNWLRTGK